MEVAVKEIDKQQLSPKVHDSLLKEIAILRHGSHANIVRFHHAILTKERIYLVLEYCDGGDLAALGILDLQGLAVGMYSGLTYGLKEAHGSHDWKNSVVAGAITGATLALTTEDAVSWADCSMCGAALSTPQIFSRVLQSS
ncbi:hypothetical protein J5N97_025107 [Dioscorea zingiberensis]|uniref:Protein kinase domain-containing protein n=1 Tax=Dioscorea zingiberensis TaxID=325984 RepID=A0A9D5H9K4_9LILI|nr:hypothetical protein J5N97_025107 [Dioscorea zingiberensis]